ncbi:unnamed protein product [Closterium sp. NIES-65]|nr:unnamed protein product [Closterium sp. NIES-65]
MPQLWSQDAGGAAEGAAVGISGSHAARHEGGGFSPSHLPAILRSLAAHQQAVEALAPLATEPRRQAGEWDGRTGEAAASAVARAAPPWRSSASLTPAVAVAAQAPGFLPAEGIFPPLPLTRPAPAASYQRGSPRSAAIVAAFPAFSSSASSAHLSASVAASLAGERLCLVGGGVSFETSQDPQLPQLEAGDGLAGGGMASSKAGAEATAEPAGAQNPSAIDALASMILVAAAAAGGQGGGFAGPPQGAAEADGDGYGEFGDRTGHGFYGHGFYGHGNVDALLQRRNTATSGTGNMGNIGGVIAGTSASAAAAKRARRSSSSGSLPPPLHHSQEDTCLTAAAFGNSQTRQAAAAGAAATGAAATGAAAAGSGMAPLFAVHQKSSPQNLRLPAAASAALPLSAQIPQSLREQLQQQLQRQTSNLSGSVSGGGGGASGGAASGGEGRPWAGPTITTITTTSLEGVGKAFPGAFPQHTQAAPNAPSPLPISSPPAAIPLHPPHSSFPASGPPDSSLVDEKLDAVAQAPGEKRRERIASQMRTLQRLVPGSSRVDTVSVLSDTIRFLCSLIHQIQSLGAEPEGYSTREAAEAAAAEVQKLVRDGVIASRRPAANQRAPSQGVTAADPAVAGGAAVAAEGPTVPGRAVAASGAVASPNAPQGSTHTSSQGPSQSMLPTVSITSPSLE